MAGTRNPSLKHAISKGLFLNAKMNERFRISQSLETPLFPLLKKALKSYYKKGLESFTFKRIEYVIDPVSINSFNKFRVIERGTPFNSLPGLGVSQEFISEGSIFDPAPEAQFIDFSNKNQNWKALYKRIIKTKNNEISLSDDFGRQVFDEKITINTGKKAVKVSVNADNYDIITGNRKDEITVNGRLSSEAPGPIDRFVQINTRGGNDTLNLRVSERRYQVEATLGEGRDKIIARSGNSTSRAIVKDFNVLEDSVYFTGFNETNWRYSESTDSLQFSNGLILEGVESPDQINDFFFTGSLVEI